MMGWLSPLNRTKALKLSLLLKLSPKKLKPWLVPWSLFLLRLLSPIRPCMKYCCHINWWELLDKPQKRICSTVGPPEPLANRQNIASLCVFYSYYFDERSSWTGSTGSTPILILWGDLLVILMDHMIFPSPFLDVMKMSMSTVSFLAQLDSGILCL